MCPPDHYDVVDVKNPFMEDHVGGVDRAAARAQWDALAGVFSGIGLDVERIDPVAGCEDNPRGTKGLELAPDRL